MIFRKDTEPCCAYCLYGSRISNTEVMCTKHGVLSSGGRCAKFRYDPLKREPSRPAVLDVSAFSEEDFTL